jgi:cysteine desulfurase
MPKQLVYLDYAAATPLDSRVLDTMEPYLSDLFYNPSANYLAAKQVKSDIEAARQKVAKVLGAKSSEIIFTAGGSEANNLAIYGVMSLQKGANLIISAIEHPSVVAPSSNFKVKTCPVEPSGLINIEALKKLIDDKTTLVSVMYVNNEIGVIEPLREVAALIKEIRKDRLERAVNLPIYFHSDAAQAANYLDLHVSRLGVDLMTLNGGKIYGPKQSGILYVRSGVKLKPLIGGGGQERGLRNGTENVAAIIGFSKALDLAHENRSQNAEKAFKMQQYFIKKLTDQIPSAVINGSLKQRIVNNVHVTFPGVDNEWLLIKLDDEGIMAAAGSACSAASVEPSAVLRAIGLSDADARSSIRFSLGQKTSKLDIDYTVLTLKKLLA